MGSGIGRFTGDWRVESTGEDVLVLVHVITCQCAWRSLTARSRTALVAVADDHAAPVHRATRAALQRHGLVDEHGVTTAGRQVVLYRPDRPRPGHPDVVVTRLDRPVIDVPLHDHPERTSA